MLLRSVTDRLVCELAPLTFGAPVVHVYNPLVYARAAWDDYVKRFAHTGVPVVLMGMNPGPFGMAQTGIPFGDPVMVREWLQIQQKVGKPEHEHPKRPVEGLLAKRREVSGSRLWGWAREEFGTPERFFAQFFVANYCPLLFLHATGKNVTPVELRPEERRALLNVCDAAFRETVVVLKPEWVIGVGNFAEERARTALAGLSLKFGRIPHPSPASPTANKGWSALATRELKALGLRW